MSSSGQNHKPKVAIVHDFLTYLGGAEQVLKSLHKIYPEAPIYTLLYEKEMDQYFPDARIKTSFLNKLPKFLKKRKKILLPLLPTAAETFDLSGYDIVISSSSSFAKGIIVKPRTLHVSYCHAPTRFLWDWHYNYMKENKIGGLKKIAAVPLLHVLRLWDRYAAERVDYFVANSQNTAQKIKKYYRSGSHVIYPPVDFKKLNSAKSTYKVPERDYYLIVSRLSPYKKIDVAVQAFNKINLPLVIIGEGEDGKRLRKMAAENVKMLGFQDESRLAEYYRNARALIFPGEDDFGITILEAMSFGKPVLALRKGGALETVIPGENGEFFDAPIPEILADGIRRLNKNFSNYDAGKIKEHASKFSRENFEENWGRFIKEVWEKERAGK